MTESLGELMQRISQLRDDELLRMVDVEFEDYRPEALAYARAELRHRGIEPMARTPEHVDDRYVGSVTDLEPDDTDDRIVGSVTDPESEPERPRDERAVLACLRCQSPMQYIGAKRLQDDARRGPLGQLGGLFKDNDDEQLDAYVCARCGRLELYVHGLGDDARPD